MTNTTRRPPILLPLAEAARPCRRCGYCCRRIPCQFGRPASVQPTADRVACAHLIEDDDNAGRFVCAIFDEITSLPADDWPISPAFGAGCCSPFNSDRRAVAERDERAAPPGPPSPPAGGPPRATT
jgi:hypothetical protein